jgi:hypothetical protein
MVFVLAACASYPLGMSKEEWVLLTPEQQMEARMKQSDLNRANAERRAQQAAARRQRYAAIEAAERRRIEEIYRSARYGDVLECVVEGGFADFRPGRRSYRPVPFTLARGEVKSVSVSAGGRNGKFWAQYSSDGLSMNLCYRDPRRRGSRYCVSVNGQSREFSAGITRRMSVKKVFRDANVVCAHRPERNMPLIYVQRHDPHVYRVIHNHHYRSRARRTPVVIHNHYSRPAPRHRTKTVIHKHYHQAPAARPAPKVVHKHHYEAPKRQRASRPDQVEPRQSNVRERRRTRRTYRSRQTPDRRHMTRPQEQAPAQAEPSEVDANRDEAPVSNVPHRARSHSKANPRSAVNKGKARSVARKKLRRRKRAKEEPEEETLISAPAKGKKWRRGKPAEE